MRRIAVVFALLLAGLAAGCTRSAEVATDPSPEMQALAAMGFEAQEIIGTASPSPAPHERWKRVRWAFNHRTLHGEAVVQTDSGTVTVVAQRGKVTAVAATSVTVQSADGYTLTWSYSLGTKLAAGTSVGIAGVKENGTAIARRIVIAAS